MPRISANLPLPFGRRRYRSGFLARRSAEDLELFRMPEGAVRDATLGRRYETPG